MEEKVVTLTERTAEEVFNVMASRFDDTEQIAAVINYLRGALRVRIEDELKMIEEHRYNIDRRAKSISELVF